MPDLQSVLVVFLVAICLQQLSIANAVTNRSNRQFKKGCGQIELALYGIQTLRPKILGHPMKIDQVMDDASHNG